ncbi:hypothetical protein ACFYQQ_01070 [Streptomyces sp. NPDC005496]|uniref:hypothetical protein n=1 Tax=unclassified Streptomyces TaxID=2593676 RepID=UPI0033BDA0B6
MITILAAVLALAAGWTIGICHRLFILPPPGCRCEDDAAFMAHQRARFEDLAAQLNEPSHLDARQSPFGWLDNPKDHP